MQDLIQEMLLKNYDKYYRLAYSYVHNEEDALDIVQEGAYKAILKSDTVKNKEFINTWIYRIMINEALQFLKKKNKVYLEAEMEEEKVLDTYEDLDLKRAMDGLEPLDKTIVVLRFFEDLKIEQIAEIMNENANTVKSRLYRTLKKLKITLTE